MTMRIADQIADRKNIKERRRIRKRALVQKHNQNKRAMRNFCRSYLEPFIQDAIRPRVAVVNSLDLPLDEKRRRIAEIIDQERGVFG